MVTALVPYKRVHVAIEACHRARIPLRIVGDGPERLSPSCIIQKVRILESANRRYLAAIDRTTGLTTAWNPNDAGRVLLHEPTPVAAVAVDATFAYFASATSGEVLRADLATAEYLGKRVATYARVVAEGKKALGR